MRRLAKVFVEWIGRSGNLLGALGFVLLIVLIALGSGSGNISHAAGPNDAMTANRFWTLYDEAMTGEMVSTDADDPAPCNFDTPTKDAVWTDCRNLDEEQNVPTLPFSIIPMGLARLRKNSAGGEFGGSLVP
jgi:heme A synthase